MPDEILHKTGKLTTEEFEVMKHHTVVGGEMLAAADKRFRVQIGKQSYLALAQVIPCITMKNGMAMGILKDYKERKYLLQQQLQPYAMSTML